MKITNKRIRNVNNYLTDIEENTAFILGVRVNKDVQVKIDDNFDGNKRNGFIPQPSIGIQSMRNTVGEFRPDKTKEKEIAYRDFYWELPDFYGGGYHSGYIEVPYKRYPRNFIEPKGLHFNYADDDKLFYYRRKIH